MNANLIKELERSDITYDEVFEIYEKEIKKCPNDIELKRTYADSLFDFLMLGYYKYPNYKIFVDNKYYQKLKKILDIIKDIPILNAAVCIIEGRYQDVLSHIQKFINSETEINKYTYDDFTYIFMVPLKNGFEGMWVQIGKMLEKAHFPLVYREMCDILEVLYYSDNSEKIVDSILSFISEHPEVNVMKELLAFTYYEMKRWKECIAYFEQTYESESIFLLNEDTVNFFTAYAYEMVNKFNEAEAYYRKVLEINPIFTYANNNLAYVLYRQKRYIEAKEILHKCIIQELDGKFPFNNMVNVLIALEEYPEVKKFAKEYDSKLSKSSKEKIKKLRDCSSVNKVDNQSKGDITEEKEGELHQSKLINLGIKKQQFSSEKILEDEIVNRMEKGMQVFGFPLKVYERKGAYGRQYPIRNGRLDILAEDNEGNLWIIELKKDNGYDDVYQQISGYMDYIKTHVANKEQNVFGIICLNNPDRKLMDKIKQSQNIKLFEYSINISQIY